MESELKTLSCVVKENPDLISFIKHPCIQTKDKINFMDGIFQNKVSPLCLKLIEILTEKHLVDLIELIYTEFKNLVEAQKNIISAKLSMAYELDSNSLANLKARIRENLGEHIEIQLNVDKNLIGGLVLQLGDFVIDGSVRQKLSNLKKNLLKV